MIETFNEYQKIAISTGISLDLFKEKHPDLPADVMELLAVAYDGLGLGEAGEVQGKIKKIIRDNGGVINDEARLAIKAELGDTLWYMASMCHNLGITLAEVATANIEKIKDRDTRGVRRGSGDYR
jgi:NTP pyrophosphatase (non-canonical NTP hydrolase)